jgi:hypothetical protein
MLPGLALPVTGILPKVAFIGSYLDTADKSGTAYSFTVDVGTIARPTLLVMGCLAHDGANARTVASATIGGVAASLAVAGVANLTCSALYYREVSAGGSVVFTHTESNAVNRGAANIWKIEDYLSPAPLATDTQNTTGASSLTGALNVPVGGVVLAAALAAGTGTVTWTGVDERHDEDLESAVRVSGGAARLLSAVAGHNVAVNFGSSRRGQLCCAVWR